MHPSRRRGTGGGPGQAAGRASKPGRSRSAISSGARPSPCRLRPGDPAAASSRSGAKGGIAAFDGREGDLALDGSVTTGLIGADWATGTGAEHWTAGLAFGHSTGSGDYSMGDCASGNCGGEVESTLTGLYPYAGVSLSERLSLWAAAGHGTGEVTLSPEGSAALSADLTMSMGAAGMRSEVLRPADGDGLALAVTGDARFTRTSSEAARTEDGDLEAAEADVSVARAGIEGSQRFALAGLRSGAGGGGASVTPSFRDRAAPRRRRRGERARRRPGRRSRVRRSGERALARLRGARAGRAPGVGLPRVERERVLRLGPASGDRPGTVAVSYPVLGRHTLGQRERAAHPRGARRARGQRQRRRRLPDGGAA